MIQFLQHHTGTDLLSIMAAFSIALIIAFALHEFAHAFVAYKLGDNTAKLEGRLTLNPVAHIDPIGFLLLFLLGFGWAKPVPVNKYNFKGNRNLGMFYVSIAGVVVNFIVAFVSYPLLQLALQNIANLPIDWAVFVIRLLTYMVTINIWLLVFNLLPVYPLDGFRVIESMSGENNRTINFMKMYNTVFMTILIVVIVSTNLLETLSSYVLIPIEWFWGLIF